MSSGKSQDVTQTTKMEPWDSAEGSLKKVLKNANTMYRTGGLTVDPYEGQRVADMSAMTSAGADALGNLSYALPAGTMEALQSNLNMADTYRDFDAIRGSVADRTKAELASTFAGGGINSGLAGDTYTRAMGDALAGVEYGAYEAAKNRQMQALGLAPQIASTQQDMERAAAAGKLTGGGIYDQYNQSLINADMQKWNENQMKDIDALSRYSAFVTPLGSMGGTTTATTSGPGTSPLSTIAGAGGTGIGAYGTLLEAGLGGPLAIGGGILAGLGAL